MALLFSSRFLFLFVLLFVLVNAENVLASEEQDSIQYADEGVYSVEQLEQGTSWLSSFSENLQGVPQLPQMNRVIELPIPAGEEMQVSFAQNASDDTQEPKEKFS